MTVTFKYRMKYCYRRNSVLPHERSTNCGVIQINKTDTDNTNKLWGFEEYK